VDRLGVVFRHMIILKIKNCNCTPNFINFITDLHSDDDTDEDDEICKPSIADNYDITDLHSDDDTDDDVIRIVRNVPGRWQDDCVLKTST